MSRHYLLDGYNIIKQCPKLADLSLSDGRERLVRWIEVSSPQGSARNHVTVVFDGNPLHFGGRIEGPVQVVFSQYQSADDLIKAILDNAKDKKHFVVVSNDKAVALYAKAHGASAMGVKDFAPGLFEGASKASKKRHSGGSSSVKNISLVQQQKINKEFEKIWLT